MQNPLLKRVLCLLGFTCFYECFYPFRIFLAIALFRFPERQQAPDPG